jgi:hypothetical protein
MQFLTKRTVNMVNKVNGFNCILYIAELTDQLAILISLCQNICLEFNSKKVCPPLTNIYSGQVVATTGHAASVAADGTAAVKK